MNGDGTPTRTDHADFARKQAKEARPETPLAVIEQVLSGMELPHDGVPRCSDCFAALEGARVAVAARRIDGGANAWHICSVRCREHGRQSAPETPHGTAVLASARVGMLSDVVAQSHAYVLADVVVEDMAVGGGGGADCAPIVEADGDGGVAR